MAERVKAHPDSPSSVGSLAREQKLYDSNLRQWLPEHEGKHVLIKGNAVVGFYGSRDEALSTGYARFGIGPLFVKQVSPSESIHQIPNAAV